MDYSLDFSDLKSNMKILTNFDSSDEEEFELSESLV